MDRKGHKWETRSQKDGQLRQKIYLGCLLVAVCCLFGGLLAKYVHESATENSQITADKFYFTTNILGDTVMTADGTSGTSYAFDDSSTEKTWNLYGASEHDIQIQVQNYFDDLRITAQEIAYEGSVTVTDAQGTVITNSSGNVFPTLRLGDSVFSTGTLTPGATDSKATSDITLSIPAYSAWKYEDGTTVTATIKSTSPYTKTLTMKFVLYATDTTLRYKVIDSAGSPFAELVLETNAEEEVQPTLTWTADLSIDNTNPLTYTYEADGFRQQEGIEARNMQISKTLETGRSESIYFFKADTSKDYSKGETVVIPNNEGTYTISIGN